MGRLLRVCQWNLTPLEERWEEIEECERQYRGTRLRASTDQIGLARLREGMDLIRIGSPLRPELHECCGDDAAERIYYLVAESLKLEFRVPVTAKLSRKFYERLGHDIAGELVDWSTRWTLPISSSCANTAT